ncbi:MAG: Rrf2 family transcriptional regulator [Alphaproteobacteria bacterium CG_4_9_14_3_um_filter_47_13]|nr:MAG: Rrf2 family transcriptional regulator [Alphaproteobacteria bacterium CG_4_9_14_3_um_filter_47_13]
MHLTAFTDYGMRVMMLLAGEPDRLFTIGDMAEELEISRNHLTKIIHRLGKADYIKTRRGKGGGFSMGLDSRSITLKDIVVWLEPEMAFVECFRKDGGNCTLMPTCYLRGCLKNAKQAFLDELGKTTLYECAIPKKIES